MCYRYWPQHGLQQYGEFSVSVMEESMHEGHLERVFSVTDSKVYYDSTGAKQQRRPLPNIVWCIDAPYLLFFSSVWAGSPSVPVPSVQLEFEWYHHQPTSHHWSNHIVHTLTKEKQLWTNRSPLQVIRSSCIDNYRGNLIIKAVRF